MTEPDILVLPNPEQRQCLRELAALMQKYNLLLQYDCDFQTGTYVYCDDVLVAIIEKWKPQEFAAELLQRAEISS